MFEEELVVTKRRAVRERIVVRKERITELQIARSTPSQYGSRSLRL